MANIDIQMGIPATIGDRFCSIIGKNKIIEIRPKLIFSEPE
jgi:hypothetical protein